jgi:hypothetical protein
MAAGAGDASCVAAGEAAAEKKGVMGVRRHRSVSPGSCGRRAGRWRGGCEDADCGGRLQIEPLGARETAEESALAWLAANAVEHDALPTDLADQHDRYLYGSPMKDNYR